MNCCGILKNRRFVVGFQPLVISQQWPLLPTSLGSWAICGCPGPPKGFGGLTETCKQIGQWRDSSSMGEFSLTISHSVSNKGTYFDKWSGSRILAGLSPEEEATNFWVLHPHRMSKVGRKVGKWHEMYHCSPIFGASDFFILSQEPKPHPTHHALPLHYAPPLHYARPLSFYLTLSLCPTLPPWPSSFLPQLCSDSLATSLI